MFPVRYKLRFYIQEEGILYSHRRENLKSYSDVVGLFVSVNSDKFPGQYHDMATTGSFQNSFYVTYLSPQQFKPYSVTSDC
jgi:hypothetical protein